MTKTWGDTEPSTGLNQRASASNATTVPSLVRTMGW